MKADDKSYLYMSNYVNFLECGNFWFQKENTRKQFLQLTFLSLPNQNISIFFSLQVKYSHSHSMFSLQKLFFPPCHFTFYYFFPIHKLTLFMLIYTAWIRQDRKQSTRLGCLPNASDISPEKVKTMISAGIIFPKLVSW